ncbi:MAG: hypothetical protein AABX29_07945 [Nanoarchaeota archaeon]
MKCEYCSSRAVFRLVSIRADGKDIERYVCDSEDCNLGIGFVYNRIFGIRTFDYKKRPIDMEFN